MISDRDAEHLERQIIGAVLKTGRDFGLSAESFRIYAAVWKAMMACREEHGACDVVLLCEWLKSAGIDSPEYMRDIKLMHDECFASPAVADAYAAALKRRTDKTALKQTLGELRVDAALAKDPSDARRQAIEKLRALNIGTVDKLLDARAGMRIALDEIAVRFGSKELPGVTTGFPTLDQLTGGLQKSDLVLIAARPKTGKTALACRMMLAAAEAGRKILLISTEQPAAQICQRLISIHSRIPAWTLRNPKAMSDAQWSLLAPAVEHLSKMPIHIHDHPGPKIGDIYAACESAEPDLVVIDYIQRLGDTRNGIYERVSGSVRDLKQLGRETLRPVLALSQIGREGRLKGSGDLEQECDQSILIQRDPEAEAGSLVLDLNRHGPTGQLAIRFEAACMRFDEMRTNRTTGENA